MRLDDVSIVRRQLLGTRLGTISRAHGNDDDALEAYRRRAAKRSNAKAAERTENRQGRAPAAAKERAAAKPKRGTGAPAKAKATAKPKVGPKASKAVRKAAKKLKRR